MNKLPRCCGMESIWVDNVPGKEYWFCRECKNEVFADPPRVEVPMFDLGDYFIDTVDWRIVEPHKTVVLKTYEEYLQHCFPRSEGWVMSEPIKRTSAPIDDDINSI